MKLENAIIEKWKKDIEFCLPGLLGAIEKQKSTTFLIGAWRRNLTLRMAWFFVRMRKGGLLKSRFLTSARWPFRRRHNLILWRHKHDICAC